VPSTFAVANAVELPDRVAADSFPLIVRPRQRCTGEGAFPKAVVLRTQADAIAFAKTFRDRPHPPLLVQEFIAGPTETQLSVAVLVNHEHRAVATFTARKIRQGQDEVGVGTYVESCCDREAEQLAVQFLERMRYVGVAEVEFKRQPGTGRLFALEVNPRVWEQVTLPAACGLNFPKMLLDLSSGVAVEARATSRRPQGWQDLWDDFYWTFRTGGYWRTKRVSLAAWLWQTFTARGHAHLAWSDPLPAAARIRQVIRTLSRR
jgi:predicted ATP-grasp superfamily ATP-dependent carboligase